MANIIGLSGPAGSGKDTVANYLVKKYGYEQLSFASSLKRAISVVFGWPIDMLNGYTAESRAWREEVDPWWSSRLGMPHLTPRWVMQYWGTDVLREHFHNEIWIASIERQINQMTAEGRKVVISDCRFGNEFKSLVSCDAKILRVVKTTKPPIWFNCALRENAASGKDLALLHKLNLTMKTQFPDIHPSEYNWVGVPVHAEIINDSTIPALYAEVDRLMSFLFAPPLEIAYQASACALPA